MTELEELEALQKLKLYVEEEGLTKAGPRRIHEMVRLVCGSPQPQVVENLRPFLPNITEVITLSGGGTVVTATKEDQGWFGVPGRTPAEVVHVVQARIDEINEWEDYR